VPDNKPIMHDAPHPQQTRNAANKATSRDFAVAFLCGGCVALMVGSAYAAVPLYSWFCHGTGFKVSNEAAHVTAGQATYNVSPPAMPVVFHAGPKLAHDHDKVSTITLSFYPAREPAVMENKVPEASGHI
jgi:cytochrome c oxidase assembly protein Cox11